MEALDQEMTVSGIQANESYGASATNVAQIFSQLTGTIEQATSAYKEFTNVVNQGEREAGLYAMWNRGNHTLDVATQLANLYGIEVGELYSNPGAVTEGHERYGKVNTEKTLSYINAFAEYALPGVADNPVVASAIEQQLAALRASA